MKNSLLKKLNKKYIIVIGTILLVVALIILYKIIFRDKIQYVVNNGYIEKTSEVYGLVALDESVVKTDESQTIVPIIEEGKRASKGEAIAIYRNSEYNEYLEKINTMDMQIETLVKDLPTSYSSDVNDINKEISNLINEGKNITSYVKMQELKTKIDELSTKKVKLISDLSPEGSKIRELIEQRENYENSSKNSKSNIKAITGGIVSYKLDNLEDKIDFKNISKIGISNINEYFDTFSSTLVSHFGIKVVNNYNAYIISKQKKGENDEYISDGKTYTIKIIDDNYKEIEGTIVLHLSDEEYNYIVFEVTNNIEDIYEERINNFEVVWKKISGLTVPKNSLKYDEQKEYYYVVALKYGNYENIPVKIEMEDDTSAIINKMKNEEKEKLGLNVKYDISLYDRIIVEN